MIRLPDRTAIRIVALRVRARLEGMNVSAILWLRIVTTREPCPTVRLPTFERQLTRTRPLRITVPLTRNRRPFNTAATFDPDFDPDPDAGTLTLVVAALCGPPFPIASISHNRTLYSPGPGAVTRAAPDALTLVAAAHVA